MPHTRRRFLRSLVALAALCLTVPLLWRLVWSRGGPVSAALAGPLARLLRRPESAQAIGREYLRSHPQERSLALLLSRLDADPVPGKPRDGFAARTRRDFERGQVVNVGGWILSRSEARLCAVVALATRAEGRRA